MTHFSSSPQVIARLLNKNVFTTDTAGASLLFQLLRLGDPCISMAWHSTWHELEKTHTPTPC